MKVIPLHLYPKYAAKSAYCDEKWAERENKAANEERQHLSQFCEQKLGVDKFGQFVYFEYNGSLDDFANKYGGSFILRRNKGENFIELRIYEQSIHDGY